MDPDFQDVVDDPDTPFDESTIGDYLPAYQKLICNADGSVTLFGVEEGEQLGMAREHAESLSTFCWVPASPGEHAPGAAKADASTSASAKDSPYVCSLAGLFAPLPPHCWRPIAPHTFAALALLVASPRVTSEASSIVFVP